MSCREPTATSWLRRQFEVRKRMGFSLFILAVVVGAMVWAIVVASKPKATRSTANFRSDVAPYKSSDRDAIIAMISSARDPEEKEHWHLLLVEIDLAKLAQQGCQTVQLSAGMDKSRLCPACRVLDQSIISVHAGARAVMPMNCTCKRKGQLYVSGWIKRSDGSGYVDW